MQGRLKPSRLEAVSLDVMGVVHALGSGLLTAAAFFWDSLFGLIFGFLISAIAQVVLTPGAMHRYLGPNLRGILYGAGFGIISSACSYGAAAAARGFYQRGADVRSVFSFLIASTNMNAAILILFWSLLGWKFAFAEFFGGIIIVAVVATGFTVLFGTKRLERLRELHSVPDGAAARVTECPLCGMEGEEALAVTYRGVTYWPCGQKHQADLRRDPERALGESGGGEPSGWNALARASTWVAIAETALNDVRMLRTELIAGYVIAGFAAALIPPAFLAGILRAVGSVPVIGYVLLLAVGLLIAVVTFVCSMGNVPVARFLANAGIPLGANTAFIYGDLLIVPLVSIYRKSFPSRITWTFVGLFVAGAMTAGAVMEWAIGGVFGGTSMGTMSLSDRLTVTSNVVALAALAAIAFVVRRQRLLARTSD
jgi:uncharacterized membrane protein YraQ (UPF0718 family)